MDAPVKQNRIVDSHHHLMGVFLTFLKLGCTSFGGPIAHVGYFRKEVVERQAWVTESQFSQLFAICQFLPGPSSSQLGFSLGMVRSGWKGALAAFTAFTLPSVALLMVFVAMLPALSGPTGQAAIHGLKLVACAVVADAVMRMVTKLCPDITRRVMAIAAAGILLFVGSAWVQLAVVVGGALSGLLWCEVAQTTTENRIQVAYGKRTSAWLFGIFLALLAALTLNTSSGIGLVSIAEAFYQAGALVFGGGHVVLPLLQESVVSSGWISEASFLSGYGAAQALPGPMFSFSAYLGAVIPTGYANWLPALVALTFMFMPGFLLISAALPVWQSISRSKRAANAIAGVNATVVGILAAALYDPIITSGIESATDAGIALIGFGLLARWRVSPVVIVILTVLASITFAS